MAMQIDQITIETVNIFQTSAPSLQWHVGPVQPKEHTSMPIEVSMTNEEKVRLAVTPMTAGGQPAQVDGAAQWSVEGACTVEPIDETSAWILSGTDIGDSTVTVAVDADLGAGVVPLGDTCLVHVGHPMATSLGLAADTPVLKD